MTRGHRGWLALRCTALSSAPLCRFIPAHVSPLGDSLIGGGASEGGIQGGKPRRGRRGTPFAHPALKGWAGVIDPPFTDPKPRRCEWEVRYRLSDRIASSLFQAVSRRARHLPHRSRSCKRRARRLHQTKNDRLRAQVAEDGGRSSVAPAPHGRSPSTEPLLVCISFGSQVGSGLPHEL